MLFLFKENMFYDYLHLVRALIKLHVLLDYLFLKLMVNNREMQPMFTISIIVACNRLAARASNVTINFETRHSAILPRSPRRQNNTQDNLY